MGSNYINGPWLPAKNGAAYTHYNPADLTEITNLPVEIMGLSIGCGAGRGGSMHLRNEKIGVIGATAIVAGGITLATGAAFAGRHKQRPDLVVSFLGDGAANRQL